MYAGLDSNNIIITKSAIKQKPTDIWIDSDFELGQTYDQITGTLSGLGNALTEKIRQINAICKQKILSGFTSSALGSIHTYKSDPDYQLNLIGLVAGGTDEPFPASTDGGQTYTWILHTAAQLKQVLLDGKARKQALIDYSNTLTTNCKNAADLTALAAIDITIGWP